MTQNEHSHARRHGALDSRAMQNMPTNAALAMSTEEEVPDVDEPPDLERTPRPSGLKLHESFKAFFSKSTPRCECKESLLTTALHSNTSSPVEEHTDTSTMSRGLSCVSSWSNNSVSTAELTSDGGFTSPGTRTSTPSPPLPPSSFHHIGPIFNKKPFDQPVSIVRLDDENISPLQKDPAVSSSGEHGVEVSLGRKRCITFACGAKDAPKPASELPKPTPSPRQMAEPPKRVCTIKFACPSKISTDAPSKGNKPRFPRAASPAPLARQLRSSPKTSPKAHRDSDSTVRNPSPISMRKSPAVDRSRRLSVNSDLARCEAFRFHEFASSEEEVEEWTQESTCHRNRLTVKDTLKIENSLRQLGEEAEEEALDDEDGELDEDGDHDAELDDDDDEDDDDDDDDEILDNENESDSDVHDDVSSDEGFQTDDEDGFAVSDGESDAGSDYNWWTPGVHSTAATSVEHLEHIRPNGRHSISESSIGSVESDNRFKLPPQKIMKRKKSRPVNIRVPSPELPDSTDFVCGTLDEDRPLEDAYLNCLERRRAAKHKATPQDIDPTFPTSDPEMDEEDEDDEPENIASESDQHLMMHGQMDPLDGELRGRRRSVPKKRSPAQSPKRLRSPPPKRTVHRSPPPRKLFGHSPKRLRSPAPVRLRSPPPTRRGSTAMSPKRDNLPIQFVGLAERPALITSSSLPRTPITSHTPEYDDDETCNELSVRRAIDIKVGLEKKRQRRKEQLYKRMHRKGAKDKRPPPGKGAERMREMGLGLAAHKGKQTGFVYGMPPTPEQKDIHVLSV